MSITKKKIFKILNKELPAIALTNEFLIITGSMGVMLIALLATFSGEISVWSSALSGFNEQNSNRLQEKIALISADYDDERTISDSGGTYSAPWTKIVLYNFGNVDSNIEKKIYDSTRNEIIDNRCYLISPTCEASVNKLLRTFCYATAIGNTSYYHIPINQNITLHCDGDIGKDGIDTSRRGTETYVNKDTELILITEYKNLINVRVQ